MLRSELRGLTYKIQVAMELQREVEALRVGALQRDIDFAKRRVELIEQTLSMAVRRDD